MTNDRFRTRNAYRRHDRLEKEIFIKTIETPALDPLGTIPRRDREAIEQSRDAMEWTMGLFPPNSGSAPLHADSTCTTWRPLPHPHIGWAMGPERRFA